MKKAVKLSSPHTYRVVKYLLAYPRATQLKISEETGVSLGWVNAVARALFDANVAVKGKRGRVELVDPISLLNRLAWDRPLPSLHIETITSEISDVSSAEKALDALCLRRGVKYALTAFSGLSRYLAHYISYPTVHAYVDDPSIVQFLTRGLGGISVELLSPDYPEILAEAGRVAGIAVAQPIQVVVDLFCLGGAGRDAAIKLYRRTVGEGA